MVSRSGNEVQMEIIILIYSVLVSYYAVDTKVELETLRDQPPRIIKEIQVKEVMVPVAAQCPIPAPIKKPDLLIHKLTKMDYEDFSKVSNAYVISLTQCMGYAEQQTIILDGYRKDLSGK